MENKTENEYDNEIKFRVKYLREHSEKFCQKKLNEWKGCSKEFTMQQSIFNIFNNLDSYFPDVYGKMMKLLEIEDEIDFIYILTKESCEEDLCTK